jgi:hypothetical protein
MNRKARRRRRRYRACAAPMPRQVEFDLVVLDRRHAIGQLVPRCEGRTRARPRGRRERRIARSTSSADPGDPAGSRSDEGPGPAAAREAVAA